MMVDHGKEDPIAEKNGWIDPVLKRVVRGEKLEVLSFSQLQRTIYQMAFQANLKSGRNVGYGAPKSLEQSLTILHDVLLHSDLRYCKELPEECLLYPFADGEYSATLWGESRVRASPLQGAVTEQQLIEFLTDPKSYSSGEDADIPTKEYLAGFSVEKLGQCMWDYMGVCLDSAAIVPVRHAAYLKELGDKLVGNFGDDSSTYLACWMFSEMLKKLAVKVISFPTSDCDLHHEEMK
jgi:hypothetical protein